MHSKIAQCFSLLYIFHPNESKIPYNRWHFAEVMKKDNAEKKKAWRKTRDARQTEKKTRNHPKIRRSVSRVIYNRNVIGWLPLPLPPLQRLVDADNACHLFFAAYFHTLI